MSAEAELAKHKDSMVEILSARRARAGAGFVATFVVLLSFLSLLWLSGEAAPTLIFLSAWPLSGLAYKLIRMLRPAVGGEDTFGVWARLHDHARASLLWPLLGAGMLLPLSLHFLLYAIFVGGFRGQGRLGLPSFSMADFSIWMGATTVLLPVAYLTLGGLSLRFASALVGPAGSPRMGLTEGRKALLYTILASCVPGALLLGVPPLVVGLTGLLFIPWSFQRVSQRFWRESEQLRQIERYQVEHAAEESFERSLSIVRSPLASLARRASAVRFLSQNYERARLLGVLDGILAQSDRPLVIMALELCLKISHRPPTEQLVRIARQNDPVMTPMAIELIALGGAAAESTLLGLIERPSILVRRAAVEALGRVGTRRAIFAIQDLVGRPVRDRVLDIAAEEAIQRIQGRLGPRQVGALSMVEAQGPDGALSLSEEARGRLSEGEVTPAVNYPG